MDRSKYKNHAHLCAALFSYKFSYNTILGEYKFDNYERIGVKIYEMI